MKIDEATTSQCINCKLIEINSSSPLFFVVCRTTSTANVLFLTQSNQCCLIVICTTCFIHTSSILIYFIWQVICSLAYMIVDFCQGKRPPPSLATISQKMNQCSWMEIRISMAFLSAYSFRFFFVCNRCCNIVAWDVSHANSIVSVYLWIEATKSHESRENHHNWNAKENEK